MTLKRILSGIFRHGGDITSGALVTFALRILGAVFNFVFYILVARSLGVEGTGEFSLILSIALAATVLTRAGMDNVVVRHAATYHIQGKLDNLRDLYTKAMAATLVLSCIVCLVLYMSGYVVYNVLDYKKNIVRSTQYALTVVPFLSVLLLQSEFLRGVNRAPLSYVVCFVGPPMLCCVYIMLVGAESVLSLLVLYMSTTGVMSFLTHLKIMRHFGTALRNKSAVAYKTLMREGRPMMLATSLDIILYWIVVLIIEIYLTSRGVGIFSVCYRVASVMVFALSSVSSISRARYAQNIHRADIPALEREVRQSNFALALCSVPIYLVIMLGADPLLRIFGPEFTEGVNVLRILATGVLCYCLTGTYPMLITMSGNGQYLQKIIFTSIVIVVLISMYLVPHYGLYGAAVALSLSMTYQNVHSYAYTRGVLLHWLRRADQS